MNNFKYYPLFNCLAICLLLITSCQDDPETFIIEEPFDIEIFQKIHEISQESQSLWSDYDYLSTYPIYLIMGTGSDQRGYLINPPTIPEGSETPENSYGLNLYRNDRFIESANADLGDLGSFNFFFDIENVSYFLLRYTELNNFYFLYKNQDHNFIPLVLTHELFHIYQIDQWVRPPNKIQDFQNYPLTPDLIALQLLMFDLMKDAYYLQTDNDMITYLKYYVSIRTEEINLDTTANQLVTNMALNQELTEGTARYVEHYSAVNSIYPNINDDPTHGWGTQLDMVSSGSQARTILAFRIWYHTGAIATQILQKLNVDVNTGFLTGLSPFDLAKDFLSLSQQELEETLVLAKAGVNWEDYMSRANEIYSLF